MKAMWRGLAAVVAAAVLVGCPGDPDEQTPDGGGVNIPDGGGGTGDGGHDGGDGDAAAALAFCQTFNDTYCDLLVDCGVVAQTARAQCLELIAQQLPMCQAAELVALGAYAFDENKAQLCLNSLQSLGGARCSGELELEGCMEAFIPDADRGEPCTDSSQCIRPGDACAGPACARVCTESGVLGGPCNDGRCNEGLHCDRDTGLCVAQAAVGEACAVAGLDSTACDRNGRCDGSVCVALPTEGEACVSGYRFPCAANLWCEAGTCRAILAEGEACVSSDQCGDAAHCALDAISPVCEQRRSEGGACGGARDCQAGLSCSDGVCTAPAGVGAACEGPGSCGGGLVCDSVLRTCQEPQWDGALNAPCTDDVLHCSSRLFCDGVVPGSGGAAGTAGTCQARVVGSPCSNHYQCPVATFCDRPSGSGAGACQTAQLGSACDAASQCLPAHYCDDEICVPRVASGELCSEDDACPDGERCVSVREDGTPGPVCAVPRGLGAPCGSPFDCQFLLACVLDEETGAGTCEPAGGQGQPCYLGVCVGGACEPDETYGTCGPLRAEGELCDAPFECASGACTDNVCAAVCP